jgi:hypothetical protein
VINDTYTEGVINDTHTEGVINDTYTEGVINDTCTEGALNDTSEPPAKRIRLLSSSSGAKRGQYEKAFFARLLGLEPDSEILAQLPGAKEEHASTQGWCEAEPIERTRRCPSIEGM